MANRAYRDAIASIESAGSGDYAAVGPRHPSLGRALGRYQVMEANIGPWSRDALGREVTADEFLANPEIQDAIFDHQFGSYVSRYGPEGAAQAWFAGPGGVGTNRRDSLGTSVAEYSQRFRDALGAVEATEQMAAGQPQPAQPGGIPSALGGVLNHLGKIGQGTLGFVGAPGIMRPGAPRTNPLAFAAPVMRSAQASIVPNLMGSVAGRTILGKHLMGMNIAPAPTMVSGHQPGGTRAIAINAQGSRPVTLMRAATGRGSEQSRSFDNDYHSGQNMSVYRANRAAVGGPITQASINRTLGSGRTMVRAAPTSSGDGVNRSGVSWW